MPSILRMWPGLAVFALLALLAPRPAAAGPEVRIGIVVIEAAKSGGKPDARLKQLKLAGKVQDLGYPSARVMDELRTKVGLDSSVTLEILGKSGKPRTLKVKVLEANPKTQKVRLKIAIPELRFETTTEHVEGGTFMVAHKRPKNRALFLAVTPKL